MFDRKKRPETSIGGCVRGDSIKDTFKQEGRGMYESRRTSSRLGCNSTKTNDLPAGIENYKSAGKLKMTEEPVTM